jgi:hypothetical protein
MSGTVYGSIGGSYLAVKSFETYKEYTEEFERLMFKIMGKEKKEQWKVIL